MDNVVYRPNIEANLDCRLGLCRVLYFNQPLNVTSFHEVSATRGVEFCFEVGTMFGMRMHGFAPKHMVYEHLTLEKREFMR